MLCYGHCLCGPLGQEQSRLRWIALNTENEVTGGLYPFFAAERFNTL
jgi:hypothetical protein